MLDAGADGDDELAEADALVERRLEFRDPRRRLVEALQHRHGFGARGNGGDQGRKQQDRHSHAPRFL